MFACVLSSAALYKVSVNRLKCFLILQILTVPKGESFRELLSFIGNHTRNIELLVAVWVIHHFIAGCDTPNRNNSKFNAVQMTAVNFWTDLTASYVTAINCAKLDVPYMYMQLRQMIWNKHYPWLVSDKFYPWINSASEMLKYHVVQVSIYTMYWVINKIQNVSLLRVCVSNLNERRKYWSSIIIFTTTSYILNLF